MQKFHVKRGDEVVVIAGSEKGKRGKILEVHTKSGRATVEGLKLLKKHIKRSQQNPQGSIVEREGSIHLSNLMAVARYDSNRAAKAGASKA
jgi:large subunit ribosomal protein L24